MAGRCSAKARKDCGILNKVCERFGLGQCDRIMFKFLFLQPMVIADYPIPRVAHQCEDKRVIHLRRCHQPINIRQGRVFPQPPRRFYIPQPLAPFHRFGRVAQHDVILHRARFKRQRHRGASGFGGMYEDVFAAKTDNHGGTLLSQTTFVERFLPMTKQCRINDSLFGTHRDDPTRNHDQGNPRHHRRCDRLSHQQPRKEWAKDHDGIFQHRHLAGFAPLIGADQ